VQKKFPEVIGLMPAGGRASRIAPLPCSKELYPIGFRPVGNEQSLRPKVVSHFLLESMRVGNIKKVYIILREGKWDIPTYFGDGKMLDMHLAYLMMDLPYGVPYTLDQAYPFINDSIVALGFPDMIFQPEDAFLKLLVKQEESHADIVLGLFPALQPSKTDMVEFDENERLRSIIIKPDHTELVYAWEIAVWTPLFSRFMHDHVLSKQAGMKTDKVGGHWNAHHEELHVGDVIQAAIASNMQIEGVIFQEGRCIDIGTPEDMIKASRMLMD
jgi:glucose-1-phosphate thymidylyltransferase